MLSSTTPAAAALRASSLARLVTAVAIVAAVAACSGAGASSAPDPQALGLGAASSGVCQAIAGLPDGDAAVRAFQNVAHDAVHRLAADARLDRDIAATVLETMQAVEADIGGSADTSALSGDLLMLLATVDDGLRAIGVPVPECAR